MNYNLGKGIQKVAAIAAKFIVSTILGFGFTQQILGLIHFQPTPEQLLQAQVALSGVILSGLEFVRNLLKVKTGWGWL